MTLGPGAAAWIEGLEAGRKLSRKGDENVEWRETRGYGWMEAKWQTHSEGVPFWMLDGEKGISGRDGGRCSLEPPTS